MSTLREALDNAVAERRFLLEHVVAFAAGLALLLAAMGVYAVTSQVVRGRARELSIRTALGASASHLILASDPRCAGGRGERRVPWDT